MNNLILKNQIHSDRELIAKLEDFLTKEAENRIWNLKSSHTKEGLEVKLNISPLNDGEKD